ncbi:MAG: hypothetical protein ACRDK3_17310 [Actinomycetota bacterium]
MSGRVVLVGAIAAAALVANVAVHATPEPTTVDRTIVGTGEKTLDYGPGDARVTRSLQWDDTGGRGRPLAAFKQVSDIHVIDEESPGRVEYFDACGSPFNSAYRVQEALSTQVGNSMLQTLSRFESGPVTGERLRFVVSTGDNVDNNQFNETRWFIDLLDGEEVKPDSGAPGYDGYTREQFSGALTEQDLERAQQSFTSVGAQSKWYAVLGNHDGLVQGNVPANDLFNSIATGGLKAFVPIEGFQDCPGDLEPATITAIVERALTTSGRAVPADPDRRFLSKAELIDEHFQTTGKPEGHGLESAPTVEGERQGYYSFRIAPKVRGISLDTVAHTGGGSNGHVPDSQFRWLERQLKKNSTRFYEGGEKRRNRKGTDRLIVLFSHHSSASLDNPPGLDDDAPYHCFKKSDAPNCAAGAGLHGLLRRFPNVVAWINGHEHNNAVRPFAKGKNQKNKARGFWEINTASHIDWPQQTRLLELAWKPGVRAKDTLFVYATVVDHAAPPELPDPESVPVEDYLAALARIEAYHDACVRSGQAKCEANGEPEDRNVKLVMKAPFDLGR